MNSMGERIKGFKMEKAWMWLLYLDFILPLLLFLAAYALRASTLGSIAARLFHSYNLYIINPIPNLANLTGILGFMIHIGAVGYALKRKDMKDVLPSTVLFVLLFLYMYFEVNYKLSYMLTFTP